MGDRSGIEWTDATWNPVTGCSHVSDGCRFCYAETLTRRMAKPRGPWKVPDLPWTAGNAAVNVILHPERLEQPLRWQRPRTVFVNSMSDLFHERIPVGFVAEVFAVMSLSERHTFQVLTKRPDRMRDLLSGIEFWMRVAEALGRRGHAVTLGPAHPVLPHVWLGVSIESRRHVDRADDLRHTPAAQRFVSAEPLLGPLLPPHRITLYDGREGRGWIDGEHRALNLAGIDWLIAGGESGEHFGERPERFLVDAPHRGTPKPEAVQWVRDLRDACEAAGTEFMLKQWGGRTPKSGGRELDGRTHDWTPPRASEAIAA